jgi:uncharacterized protein YndB with AHSA1/START domain
VSGQVEITFEVAVPIERAWQAFTDGAERSQWEAPDYEIDPRPGGRTHWQIPPWEAVDGEVVEVDAPHRLVHTDGPGPDGPSTVTVTFESVATGTRITVVHAGFGDGATWQHRLEGHRRGWYESFQDLVLYLETGVASRRFFNTWHVDMGMALAEEFAGVRVTEVEAGSWAAEAGLEVGDLVLYVDGQPIYQRTDLWPFNRTRRSGERLEVTVARGDSMVTGTGTLRPIASAM